MVKKLIKKFICLKWITPDYKNNSTEEIALLNQIKLHLENDNRTKMLITNYSFFSSILNEKLFSPSRWYISDGTDYPSKNSRYFHNYKNLLIRLIQNNNIDVIYIIYPQKSTIIYDYIDKNCFEEIKISKILNSFELKKCGEIKLIFMNISQKKF